ncbi:hypothetical protein [Bacillus thuringiensis]|uniref:hypothetical protein n=1 Tax=Bacillus thuringiensis TaxID=1428 RepID=UPI000BFB7BBC|nr:hypothetical protein [Bacillus thuringiensis]PGT89843.1 hypothetical protein COD17_08830 [Bacillus thuringiensis]
MYELTVTIDNEQYKLAFTKEENRRGMPNCLIYTCRTFDTNDMVSFRNFTIIYNMRDKRYWSWTANTISQKDIEFRNKVADLLNEGSLQLAR